MSSLLASPQVAAELSESIQDLDPLSLADAAPRLLEQLESCLADLLDEAQGLDAFDSLHGLNCHVASLLTDEAQQQLLTSTVPDMNPRHISLIQPSL